MSVREHRGGDTGSLRIGEFAERVQVMTKTRAAELIAPLYSPALIHLQQTRPGAA